MKSDRKGGYSAPKKKNAELTAMRPGMGGEADLRTGVKALREAHNVPDLALDRTNLPNGPRKG